MEITKEPILTIQLLESKKDGRDQETIQSSTTPDPGYHMGSKKNTINIHKHENHVGVDKVTLIFLLYQHFLKIRCNKWLQLICLRHFSSQITYALAFV